MTQNTKSNMVVEQIGIVGLFCEVEQHITIWVTRFEVVSNRIGFVHCGAHFLRLRVSGKTHSYDELKVILIPTRFGVINVISSGGRILSRIKAFAVSFTKLGLNPQPYVDPSSPGSCSSTKTIIQKKRAYFLQHGFSSRNERGSLLFRRFNPLRKHCRNLPKE